MYLLDDRVQSKKFEGDNMAVHTLNCFVRAKLIACTRRQLTEELQARQEDCSVQLDIIEGMRAEYRALCCQQPSRRQ